MAKGQKPPTLPPMPHSNPVLVLKAEKGCLHALMYSKLPMELWYGWVLRWVIIAREVTLLETNLVQKLDGGDFNNYPRGWDKAVGMQWGLTFYIMYIGKCLLFHPRIRVMLIPGHVSGYLSPAIPCGESRLQRTDFPLCPTAEAQLGHSLEGHLPQVLCHVGA